VAQTAIFFLLEKSDQLSASLTFTKWLIKSISIDAEIKFALLENNQP